MSRLSPTLAILLIIAAGTAVRLALAAAIGLGVDESYVVPVARVFSLSYLDHPPLHFWIIWLTTHLTGSEHPLVLRLPFILLFAGTTWMTFRLGQRFFSDWAGVYAALVLNVSAVFSLSSGGWILPDGPLMFLMLATTLTLSHILFTPSAKNALGWWILAGLLLGLGLLSKYHAIFVAAGCFFFLLTSKRHRYILATPGPYLAVVIAAILFSPVLIWNYENGWASFVFQGSRGVASGLYPKKMFANIAGQAAWVLPWVWFPLVVVMFKALVKGSSDWKFNPRQSHRWFLCCLALGPIAVFTLATLWGAQGLFHWQAPGYLLLFPLLGEAIAGRLSRNSRGARIWLKSIVAVYLLIILILGTHTATGWLAAVFPKQFAKGDPTYEAFDWRGLPPTLTGRGLLNSQAKFVVSPHWIDTGKIDYALGGRLPVLCLSNAPHHFAFMYKLEQFTGQDALIIGRKHIASGVEVYRPYFDSIEPLDNVILYRNGRPAVELRVFYARNFHGYYPLPYGIK